MIFVKNFARREDGLVEYSRFLIETHQSDVFPFDCENYSDGNDEIIYYDGVRICIDCSLLASVGLNIKHKRYSQELLFDTFKAVFNKFFEDEVVKHIDEKNCIIDIYDVIKKSRKMWCSIIGNSYEDGFPNRDLKKFVYSKLDEIHE